jgi:rsbT co-antagonist protein RsbR
VWPGIVALPVIGTVDQERVARMMESVLTRIVQTRARFVILDLTGADTMDEVAAGNLLRIAGAVRLLGAGCLLSGISPAMSATLVEIGVEFQSINAYSSLETALQEAIRRLK